LFGAPIPVSGNNIILRSIRMLKLTKHLCCSSKFVRYTGYRHVGTCI
jgi:hypothetical protein